MRDSSGCGEAAGVAFDSWHTRSTDDAHSDDAAG
jgi:hypothetical protein